MPQAISRLALTWQSNQTGCLGVDGQFKEKPTLVWRALKEIALELECSKAT
jgi:hypothetical protein